MPPSIDPLSDKNVELAPDIIQLLRDKFGLDMVALLHGAHDRIELG